VLPDTKADIERRILSHARAAAETQGRSLYDLVSEPIQNAENDFDFTLETTSGRQYLDLVEVVLAGGYEGASNAIEVGSFADQLWALVKKKSQKYGVPRRHRVHLLLYSTHWKFLPSDSVIDLLSLYCARKIHSFISIAIVVPIDHNTAQLWRVFPPVHPAEIELHATEIHVRARVLHQLSPFNFTLSPDLAGVSWEIPSPPAAP
jgi:hypothetical protein